MKKIAIIGANGMLGADLVSFLQKYFSITPITKDNYASHIHKHFDIVINANGNSKRFWANMNPVEDFALSTTSVYKSFFDFPTNLYIYISSSDVYENHTSKRTTNEDNLIQSANLSSYGFHKYVSELLVKKYCKNYLILRCSMMLGSKLRKGPIYDILQNTPLFIANESKLQIITTNEISQFIYFFIKQKNKNKVYNIGGKGTVAFNNIEKYMHSSVRFSKKAEKQHYEMDVTALSSLFPLKTSLEYLQDFLDSLQSQ